MPDQPVVTASDIARLSGMSRAAVSNWRRRYPDFPDPVGGTSSSPTYHLDDVRDWLRRHDKTAGSSVEQALQSLWQRIRGQESTTVTVLASVGRFLSGEPSELSGDLLEELERLTRSTPSVDIYAFLLDRFRETVAQRLSPTPVELVDVTAAVLPDDAVKIYDPACGLCSGFIELARRRTGPVSLLGQDSSSQWIELAGPRLRLLGLEHRLAMGDSIHDDGFIDEPADAALCDVPVGTTDWDRDRLANDPRLTYGVPPRAEPELLWVQHCLAHVKPGGLVFALMPAAAAYRRSGRRIRAELLRRGALLAVIAPDEGGSHIWVLCRPVDSAPPSQLLLAVRTDIAEFWDRFSTDRHTPIKEADAVTVPVVTLLDDTVDVTPGVWVRQVSRRPVSERFADQTDALRDALGGVHHPSLVEASAPDQSPTVTVADLERQGALSIETTRTTAPKLGYVVIRQRSDGPRAAVYSGEPDDGNGGDYVVRCERDQLDSYWLAAALTASMSDRPPTTSTAGGGYVRQLSIARLPLPEQQSRGRAFRAFMEREERLRRAAEAAAALTVTAAEALATGRMHGDD